MANGLLDIVNSFPLAMNAQQGGLSQMLQAEQPFQQQIPQVQAPKPSAFAKGGKGWEILGIIGDALQTAGGGQATYGPMMAEQRQEEERGRQRLAELMMQQQQRQADRDAALQDRMKIIDYQRENPAPDAFGRALMGAGIDPASAEAQALYRKRAEMLTNPVQLVPDGMGGYQAVRPNGAAGGLQPGHTEDGYTFMGGDPGDPSNWSQGGAGTASGMFP